MVNFSVPCGNGNPEGWVQQQDNSEFCYLLYSDALMFFDDANDYCKTQVKFFSGEREKIRLKNLGTFIKKPLYF